MRIATFNIWNSPLNWTQRRYAIADEIKRIAADFVLIQEAPIQAEAGLLTVDFLRTETDFTHAIHLEESLKPEDGEWPEGLAMLSECPLDNVKANWETGRDTANNWAMRVIATWRGLTISLTNVHLDWKSEQGRQEEIVRILEQLVEPADCDLDIIAGDFNDDSAITSFLEGRTAIAGKVTTWRDLVAEACAAAGETVHPTLDPGSNPRWKDEEIKEEPRRFDRIYLRSNTEGARPIVVGSGIFGKEPRNRFGIVPSDHYGVYVDIEIPSS